MEEIVLRVNGMRCNGCENRIQNAISQIEGIESVIADYINATVTINYTNKINIDEIKEKIEDLGFEIKEN